MVAGLLTVLHSIPGRRCLITRAPGLGWFISRIRIRFVGGLICSFWWIIWSRFLSFAWLLASGFWLLASGGWSGGGYAFLLEKQLAALRHLFPAEKRTRPLTDQTLKISRLLVQVGRI